MLTSRLQGAAEPGRPNGQRAVWLELGIAGLVLAVLMAVAYARYARDAGFIADDWATVARAHFADSTWQLLQDVFDDAGKRPGLVLYSVLTTRAFGMHGGAYVLLGMVWIGLSGLTLYALLRRLGLSAITALAIPFLAVVFPACTSLHLWLANYYGNLSLAAAFGGLLAAVAAFDAGRGRRGRIGLHALASTLFVISAVTYEVADALIGLSIVVYAIAGIRPLPWKRWAADVAIVGFCAWAFTTNHLVTDRQAGLNNPRGFDVIRDRAQMFLDQTVTVFNRTVPFEGPHTWLVPLVIALVLGTGVGALRAGRLAGARQARLREGVAVVLGGIVLLALAYAVFVPADDFYAPASPNLGDRVNALAMFGYVAVIYGTALLAVRLVGVLLRPDVQTPRAGAYAWAVPAVLVAVLLGLGAWYTARTRNEVDLYVQSARIQRDVLAGITQDVPDHPDGTAIYTWDYPVEVAPQLPVFYANDLRSALQLKWNQRAITGGPVRDLNALQCTAHGIAEPVAGPAPYGPHTYFVSINDGRAVPITSQARCERARTKLGLRPVYPMDRQGGSEGA